jgi:hypothetical protein
LCGTCGGFAARTLTGCMDCWKWNGEACLEVSDVVMLAKGSAFA